MMKSTVRTMVIGVFGLGRALDPGRGQVTGRVLTTSVVAIVALAAAGCGGAQRLGGHERMGGPRYTDPAGWSVQHPGLTVEHSGADMRASVSEVTFASFAQRPAVHVFHSANSGGFRVDPPFDRTSGRYPADGIALRIVREGGGPPPDLETPETGFPIRLADFTAADFTSTRAPRPKKLTVAADGNSFFVLAWVGPNASAAAHRLLDRVIGSLSFPPLRPGTTVGEGFQVFQPVDRYPLGMFLRVLVAGQPFWLVRAPGGFYTVGWREQTTPPATSPAATCASTATGTSSPAPTCAPAGTASAASLLAPVAPRSTIRSTSASPNPVGTATC